MLLSAALCLSVSGCQESDGTGYVFKYDIPSNPATLDPQTAYDGSSLEIIANMFTGLLKTDSEGNVECAAAESYDVSDDGLVYTFKLREDIFWTDGDEFKAQCTANDFVFGFQRLLKPATKSVNAGDFFCIKNAQAVNKGVLTDLSQLGVRAENDFTLEITLEYPNPSFPVMLTTTPAMPCNEEYYYSTDGKYGLTSDAIASNGAFYLYKWSYDYWSTDNNYVILRVNPENNKNGEVCPYGLNFFIEEPDRFQNFIDEQSHVYITSGNEAAKLLEMGYSYSENKNGTIGVLFNTKDENFRNADLRKALAYSINSAKIELEIDGYEKAKSLIPSSIKLGDEAYRDIVKESSALTYDSKTADTALKNAFEHIDRSCMSGTTLYIPDNDAVEDYVSSVAQQWQAELGFYCNIKRLEQGEYDSVLKSGNFDMIVTDISGSFNSPYAYLSSFISNGGGNYGGYSNGEFDMLMSRAESAKTVDEGAELYLQAEKNVTGSAAFIPLLEQSKYAFFGEDCEDIIYNPFTDTVIFEKAKRFD